MIASRKYEQLREMRERDFEAQRELRAVVGKPSANKTKPWLREGVSRANWYRRRELERLGRGDG